MSLHPPRTSSDVSVRGSPSVRNHHSNRSSHSFKSGRNNQKYKPDGGKNLNNSWKKGTPRSKLPVPNVELEDGLVGQLSIGDVMNNCVSTTTNWNPDETTVKSTNMTSSTQQLYHRCYNDGAKLNPVWMAFHSCDIKSCGEVKSSNLQHLILLLKPFTNDVTKQLNDVTRRDVNTSNVKFQRFQSFINESLSNEVNPEDVAVECWNFCKSRFLIGPYVEEDQPVVPENRVEPVFWLFCIFCRLAEPGFYPPSIDYEEAELLMRKMMACLGVPWSNTSDHVSDDSQSCLTEDYQSTKLLLVTFQQLLSITAEMVGSDLIRSPAFYYAIKWLCLTEFCDVLKANVILMKNTSDQWKKRWCVLRGFTMVLYSSQQATNVKHQIILNENMNVESLPPTSTERKFRFRIVEKDGDFKIKREIEFIVTDERELRSWINVINMTIKLSATKMTAKSAEIAERRYERHRRRDSLKDVSEKRKDVHHVRSILHRIRQDRLDLKTSVEENRRKRKVQMELLKKMDEVYDKIEDIHKKDRDSQKIENNKLLQKFVTVASDDVTTICQLLASNDVKLSRDVIEQRTVLENELERLRHSTIASQSYPTGGVQPPMVVVHNNCPEGPHLAHHDPHHQQQRGDVDSCYDTRTTSSSETSSCDVIPPPPLEPLGFRV